MFMQVLVVEGVRKLFFGKEIAVFRFWDGDRGFLAPDAIKYKFKLFRVFFCLLFNV